MLIIDCSVVVAVVTFYDKVLEEQVVIDKRYCPLMIDQHDKEEAEEGHNKKQIFFYVFDLPEATLSQSQLS